MEDMVRKVTAGEGGNLAGYIGQFADYEGLTCNVFEWMHSASFNASLINKQTKSIEFRTAETAGMLDRVQRWFETGIVPKYAITYIEGTSHEKWRNGEALFMRNWPYVIKSTEWANPPWTWGVAPLPGVTKELKGASTLGGFHLAVNKYTKVPNETVQVVKFLSSPIAQRIRAIENGILPTIPSLFEDPAVCAKIGFCDIWRQLRVVIRPSAQASPQYMNVSQELSKAVHLFLKKQTNADTMFSNVEVNSMKAMSTYSSYGMYY
jgi:trehalose/maltose transport system substrate-binding protein